MPAVSATMFAITSAIFAMSAVSAIMSAISASNFLIGADFQLYQALGCNFRQQFRKTITITSYFDKF